MKGFALCFLYLLTVGILSNLFAMLIPRHKLQAEHFPFRLYGFERGGAIYDAVRIKKWKTRVPDMSKILKSLAPKKIDSRINAERVLLLLREGCVAEAVHWALMIASLPCIWLWRYGFLMSILFSIGNLPFIMIQRYNRPRQLSLYGRLKDR